MINLIQRTYFALLVAGALFLGLSGASAESWWKPEWTTRKQITLDTTAKGSVIGDPIGGATVLVRLYDGNFQFAAAKEDGSDLRFVASDDKTLLPHHIERWDTLLNEALVWVKLPEVAPAGQTSFWLYYGNSGDAPNVADTKGSFDAETMLAYHFAENGGAPVDSTASAITADKGGASVPGALVAGGIRLLGQAPITLANAAPIAWTAGGSFTFSSWIKSNAPRPNAVIFSRRDAGASFIIGDDNGVPYVEVTSASGTLRTPAGAPMAVNTWKHLVVTVGGAAVTLYLDGVSYGTVAAPLPAMASPIFLGKDSVGDAMGFSGELDEMQFAKVARPAGWVKFAFVNQGVSPEATKLLVPGEDEASTKDAAEHSEIEEHLTLLKDISKSLTFDGWVVIVLCGILAVVGWAIAIAKFFYLNRISKASTAFLKQWSQISTDITALDHADEENIKSMGASVNKKEQRLLRQSPLFSLYHLGSQEIQHRINSAVDGFKGLSGRSIEAIRAILDGGQVREVQKLNGKLVYLTIGIAGGPYLGLLGTVIGVMITFAVIAKSGEVEINSIAPGIAGALLATVAGLAVAIPALFAYSYLSSRIKDAVANMQTFIDEFIARVAEAYPSANE